MENPETLVALCKHDKGRRQTKHKNTTQKTKQMSNTNPICKICYKSEHYNNNHNPDRQNITPLKSKIKSKQENKRISKKSMNDTIPYGHNNSLKMLKGLIGIYKSQDRQHNGQKKSTNEQTTIYETLCTEPKIEEHQPHQKPRVNSCAPKG
jgi:hypothetical protein